MENNEQKQVSWETHGSGMILGVLLLPLVCIWAEHGFAAAIVGFICYIVGWMSYQKHFHEETGKDAQKVIEELKH